LHGLRGSLPYTQRDEVEMENDVAGKVLQTKVAYIPGR
jgi:hypothetical protein